MMEKNKNIKESDRYNLINGIIFKNIEHIIYEFKIEQNYKKLQIKYKNEIIFQMINLNINNYSKPIFKCIYNNKNKIIEFNLFDIKNENNYVYYNTYLNKNSEYNYFSIYLKNNLNLYEIIVFYNVIYSLENKLLNQVSSKESNQEFINEQNI